MLWQVSLSSWLSCATKLGQSDRALLLAQEAAQIWTKIGSPQAPQAHDLIAQLNNR